jgi:NADPH:quinone reductase-like Zn-dependent oxidoreductase
VIVAPTLEFAAEVRRVTGGRGADVALEITGASTFDQTLRSLAPAGRVIVVGNLETGRVALNPGLVILKELEILGAFATSVPELQDAFHLVLDGTVRPVVSRIMPLAQAAEAHRLLHDRAVTGRIVLEI